MLKKYTYIFHTKMLIKLAILGPFFLTGKREKNREGESTRERER